MELFQTNDNGEVRSFLNISVNYSRDKQAMFLNQPDAIKELLEKFEMQDCKPASTPIADAKVLFADD